MTMFRTKRDNESSRQKKLLTLISHDLKSPLESFESNLERLKKRGHDEQTYELFIECMISYVHSSRYLVNNVLSVAKQLLEIRGPVSQPVLPRLQADLIILSLKFLSLSKRVTIKNQIQEIGQVRLNLPVFEFVFRNLLVNSIKFCYTYGHIETGIVTAPDSVTISISDDGPGILQPHIDQLKALMKAGNEKQPQRKDTNLSGLFLCAELLKTVKGNLWAGRKPQGGSIFYFKIPAEF